MGESPQADAGHAKHCFGKLPGKEQGPPGHRQYGKEEIHHRQIEHLLERVELALFAVRVRMRRSYKNSPQVVAGLPEQSWLDITGHDPVVTTIPESQISVQEQTVEQSQQCPSGVVNQDIGSEPKRWSGLGVMHAESGNQQDHEEQCIAPMPKTKPERIRTEIAPHEFLLKRANSNRPIP